MKYICKKCKKLDYANSFYHIVQRQKLCMNCIKKRHNKIRYEQYKKSLS